MINNLKKIYNILYMHPIPIRHPPPPRRINRPPPIVVNPPYPPMRNPPPPMVRPPPPPMVRHPPRKPLIDIRLPFFHIRF